MCCKYTLSRVINNVFPHTYSSLPPTYIQPTSSYGKFLGFTTIIITHVSLLHYYYYGASLPPNTKDANNIMSVVAIPDAQTQYI